MIDFVTRKRVRVIRSK